MLFGALLLVQAAFTRVSYHLSVAETQQRTVSEYGRIRVSLQRKSLTFLFSFFFLDCDDDKISCLLEMELELGGHKLKAYKSEETANLAVQSPNIHFPTPLNVSNYHIISHLRYKGNGKSMCPKVFQLFL